MMKFNALILSIVTFIKMLFGISSGPINPSVITLKAPTNINFSAISLKTTYKYTNEAPSISDADPKKEGIQAQINTDLTQKGWVYPVNKIVINTVKKEVDVELALINLETQGFSSNSDLTLGTINFTSDTSKLTFSFDPSLTKLIEKSGSERQLDFKNNQFVVK